MSRRTEEPAYLLHSTPYRETSLVVDLFTREHGRLAAVAKGAKRPFSALRGVLLQFQPLLVAYTGRNELRNLTAAQWLGGSVPPRGDALLCAFYLNELLVRLLPREDPHPALYDGYARALDALAAGGPPDEVLRRFEWLLLRETGYAPDLEHDAERRPIDAARLYRWLPASGFVAGAPVAAGAGAPVAADAGELAWRAGEPGVAEARAGGARAGGADAQAGLVSGATLRELAAGRFDSAATRAQAKYLTRAILAHHLDGAVLNTRQILIELQKL